MDRVSEFEHLRFGMFIHFGLYSQAEKGEWAWLLNQDIRKDYDRLFEQFNPVNLDWHDIVSMAKQAGCKYIVLTTRHHEGFSLYDTRGLSDYDVMHTPYGHDIVKDYVTECRKQGIVPFLYHTTLDWQNPDFKENFPKYQQYLRDSVKVLCQNYGRLGGFWFDGNWSRADADWEEDALYQMIRQYQPEAILTNNSGLQGRGIRGNGLLDTVTFEQGHLDEKNEAETGRHVAMEACETMNHNWGAAEYDLDYRTPRDLIEMLNRCRKTQANYLLNIGLNGDGSVPIMSRALLHQLGVWTNYAKDSFYDGTMSKLKGTDGVYALDHEGYTDVYCPQIGLADINNPIIKSDSFEPNVVLKGPHRTVASIRWLDNSEALEFKEDSGHIGFYATQFPYGVDLVVRIARITWKA
jgi:alpha-L-fucosidase